MAPNILIVCEHATDTYGGEAILPLRYFTLLSKRLENVYLLTHERVRARLETIPEIPINNIYYIPDTKLHVLLNKISSKLPDRIAFATTGILMHLLTQFYQRLIAKKIIRERKIDLVHEPTPVSPRQPSMMFGLGIPVIIGPMNGGMDFPPTFSHMAGMLEKKLFFLLRSLSSFFNLLIPGKLFASLLLVANQRSKNNLPLFRFGKTLELVENGVLEGNISFSPHGPLNKNKINILYAGRLIDLKLVDVLIHAVNMCITPNIHLTIVGDGPTAPSLRALAASYGNENIEFTGWVNHDKMTDYYDAADIFALPSVRECGGAVVLEAMARGVPIIATDWGGPQDYLDEKTGFLVAPDSFKGMINKFAEYIDLLAGNSDMRINIGIAAIRKVKDHFTWEAKIESILFIYDNILKKNIKST